MLRAIIKPKVDFKIDKNLYENGNRNEHPSSHTMRTKLHKTFRIFFSELLNHTCPDSIIFDREKAIQSFVEREKLGSTAVGKLSYPHINSIKLDYYLLIICRFIKPVEWPGSFDNNKVKVSFIAFSQPVLTGLHMKLIGTFLNKNTLSDVDKENSDDVFYETFKNKLLNFKEKGFSVDIVRK
jgi:mannitol/fructose-specific phosphotransferase system IIA component (Ntr-type)